MHYHHLKAERYDNDCLCKATGKVADQLLNDDRVQLALNCMGQNRCCNIARDYNVVSKSACACNHRGSGHKRICCQVLI